MYSIYVTTTVISTCIALQEVDNAYVSGVPLKESLSFLTSQERKAKENKVLFFKPRHIASKYYPWKTDAQLSLTADSCLLPTGIRCVG